MKIHMRKIDYVHYYVILRAQTNNWIDKAIVVQSSHKAIPYVYLHGSINTNYMCGVLFKGSVINDLKELLLYYIGIGIVCGVTHRLSLSMHAY